MTYSGAPDECSYHFVWGWAIVRLDEHGNCPKQEEHYTFGPGAHFGDTHTASEGRITGEKRN